MRGRWMAPPTLATTPTQGHNIDDVTALDAHDTDDSPHDSLSATNDASPPSANHLPWPAPDPFEMERARLVSEIATVKERAANVRARITSRELEMKVALRAEFTAARGVLAEMEREHEARIAAVRAAAQAEVERILAEARRTQGRQSSAAKSSGASDAN
jgi:hypothetical protein